MRSVVRRLLGLSWGICLVACGSGAAAAERRIALLRFENRTQPEAIRPSDLLKSRSDDRYDFLERALPDMLTTDLHNAEGIRLVERGRVEGFLEEISLGRTGAVDEKTVQLAGKVLLADELIYGSIEREGDAVAIRASILNVERKEEVRLAKALGRADNILDLVQVLSGQILGSLKTSNLRKMLVEIPADSTLAILPFNDDSSKKAGEALRMSFPTFLEGELTVGPRLQLVERSRISAVMQELLLGQVGYLDQRTALRIGRLVGAQYVALGAVFMEGRKMRVDLRVARVETSAIVLCAKAEGSAENPLGVASTLAGQIRRQLRSASPPGLRRQ